MIFSRLRFFSVAVLLVFAASCSKDDEVPAYVVNNSVHPADFLTANTYTTLNIEVAYVEGYEPTAAVLSALKTFLSDRINKSSITISTRVIPTTNKVTLDLDAIRALEKDQRQSKTSGNTLTAWIMFLDVEYSESTNTEKVLGITYGPSSIAIFEKSVFMYTKPDTPARGSLETVVLTHEFGHIFGLVNSGTAMQNLHQDSDHGAHCSNPQCLMYWKTEQNVKLTDVLGSPTLPDFDADCLADLKHAGGK